MSFLVELDRTAQRLRQLPEPRLLAHEEKYAQVLAAIADRPVPRVEPRAWGDQLLVVGRACPPDRAEAHVGRLIELRRCFDLVL